MELLQVTAHDGTRLACWDFGGEGQPVLMLHGTGLHGRCWAPVARSLGEGFRAVALDMRGHGASGRSPDGGYDWQRFGADTLAVLDQLGLAGRSGVIGAGHSAGATALLLAEATRPGSFSRLWAWEPIMAVPGRELTEHQSADLARRARRRRADFASVEDAKDHFVGRGQFAGFSREAMEAFLSGAFVDGQGGVRLACDPEDEARMYEGALAHNVWDNLTRVRCPARMLGGERSTAVPPDQLAEIAKRLPAGEMLVVPGLSHFGPFESPALVAGDIAKGAARPE
jgi:pimeloyl-ACP methyl ester carboxylesterase